MPVQTHQIRVLTPLFLSGAHPRGGPELRASSIRGQLRYWWRAVLGARYPHDLAKVWSEESRLFGSTSSQSPVMLRLRAVESQLQFAKYFMLPHREEPTGEDIDRRLRTTAIGPDSQFLLDLLTKPGAAVPSGMLDALRLWHLLGGLGKRSRRGFGALQTDLLPEFSSSDQLATYTRDFLTLIIAIKEPWTSPIPKFPVLHQEHVRVLVCHKPYSSYEDAMITLLGLTQNE